MKLKIGDLIIISIIILAAIIMIVPKKSSGEQVILTCNGKEVAVFDLDKNTEYIFHGSFDNKLVIENGYAFISESDCPDKVCVHSKKISKSGETICCLPNKVLLSVVSEKHETDVISK